VGQLTGNCSGIGAEGQKSRHGRALCRRSLLAGL
jgi:hypothetical protein